MVLTSFFHFSMWWVSEKLAEWWMMKVSLKVLLSGKSCPFSKWCIWMNNCVQEWASSQPFICTCRSLRECTYKSVFAYHKFWCQTSRLNWCTYPVLSCLQHLLLNLWSVTSYLLLTQLDSTHSWYSAILNLACNWTTLLPATSVPELLLSALAWTPTILLPFYCTWSDS